MRSLTTEAHVYIAMGMGVLGMIVGEATFPLIAPAPPVPRSIAEVCKERKTQGWNACEMDLVTCQMELAGAQEEIAVRQQQSPAVPRSVVCEPSLPKGCTETCRSCFQAMAEITKILEEP